MQFLKNAWYCAAWGHEVTRTPLARTLLNKQVERHALAWIWMGDPARADASQIPDFSAHDDSGFVTVGGRIPVQARNFRRQDTAFGDSLRQAIGSVFTNEDGAMIAKVQANMGAQTDLVAMRPVILPTDRAAIQARMTLKRLIAHENRQSASAELAHA
jgi:hypothetical protein